MRRAPYSKPSARSGSSSTSNTVCTRSRGLGVSIVLAALAMQDADRREELLEAGVRYGFEDLFLELVLPELLED